MVAQAGRKPTICQLLHTLHMGGAEVLAARLARKISPQFRVVFVCLDELGTLGEELRTEGFKVHVLRRKPGLDWHCISQLSGVLRQERVDLIHAHQYTPFFYALLGRWLYRRPPILFTEHGRHQPDYRRPKRVLANRLLLERRDRVVGVGETVRQAVIRHEGIPAARVGVIYNGIDLETYHNGSQNRETVRRELGLHREDWLILQVARLDYLKDHATAVRTLARILPQLPKAHLVLVGDGPEYPQIERLVRQQALEGRVHFLGLRTDVAGLLAAADVFLLSSISEGIPLTVLEAMAAELPVISTKVGGVAEIIADGQTGLLAPARDDRTLADKILHLAAHPEFARQMGQAGHRRVAEMFSESSMCSRYQNLFEEMLREL